MTDVNFRCPDVAAKIGHATILPDVASKMKEMVLNSIVDLTVNNAEAEVILLSVFEAVDTGEMVSAASKVVAVVSAL